MLGANSDFKQDTAWLRHSMIALIMSRAKSIPGITLFRIEILDHMLRVLITFLNW